MIKKGKTCNWKQRVLLRTLFAQKKGGGFHPVLYFRGLKRYLQSLPFCVQRCHLCSAATWLVHVSGPVKCLFSCSHCPKPQFLQGQAFQIKVLPFRFSLDPLAHCKIRIHYPTQMELKTVNQAFTFFGLVLCHILVHTDKTVVKHETLWNSTFIW